MIPINKEKILSALRYESETGSLYWTKSQGRRKAGDRAGGVCSDGYVRVQVDGERVTVHRVIWVLEGNDLPPQGFVIDHIDGNAQNNHISNLRLATHAQNMRNSKSRVNSITGMSGVTYNRREKKWMASITANRIQKRIGAFARIEDAIAARLAAELAVFGEFAPSIRGARK